MSRDQLQRAVAAGVVVAFAAVAIVLAAILNVWVDESFSLNTTSDGLLQAFHRAIVFEWQAPMYFVVLDAWRHVDASVWFARFFSVCCAVGTLVLVPGLVRRYAPAVPIVWPVLVFASSPFVLWAALEIRPYPLVMLLSALFMRALFDEFLADVPQRMAGVPLTGAALILTHYFAGAIVAGGFAAVAATGSRRSVLRYLRACMLMAACACALAVILPQQIGAFRSATPSPGGLLVVRELLGGFARFLVPGDWSATAKTSALVVAVFAAAYLSAFRSGRAVLGVPARALLALTTVTFLTFWVGTRIVGSDIVLPRYASAAFVPSALLPFALVSSVQPAVRARLGIAWTVATVAFGLFWSFQTYAPLAKQGDWIRVARYVEASPDRDLPIVAFKADDALALELSLDRPADVRPMPAPISFDRPWSVDELKLTSADAAARFLRANAGARGRLWLVSTDVCTWLATDYGCTILESAVQRDWVVRERRAFYRSQARLLERRG